MTELDEFKNVVVTLEDLGISGEVEDLAVMPSEVEFGPGTFIARWDAGNYFYFMTTEDITAANIYAAQEGEAVIPVPDRMYRTKSGKFMCYYTSFDACEQAMEILGEDTIVIDRQRVWMLEAPTSTVLNSADLEALTDGFGETLHFHCQVVGLRPARPGYPARNRHKWNLVTLPAAVVAAAQVSGYRDAEFDMSEITDPGADLDADEFKELFGDIYGSFRNAVYYQRRAKLWEQLGESNPRKSEVIGALTAKGQKSSKATKSEVLSKCLTVTQGRWKRPLWAEVMNLTNPDPDDTYGFAVLTRIFVSEAHARAVAAAELAERGLEPSEPTEVVAAGHPGVPLEWGKTATADDVVKVVSAYIEDNLPPVVPDSGPPPVIDAAKARLEEWEKAALVGCYMSNTEQLYEWVAYVQGG